MSCFTLNKTLDYCDIFLSSGLKTKEKKFFFRLDSQDIHSCIGEQKRQGEYEKKKEKRRIK